MSQKYTIDDEVIVRAKEWSSDGPVSIVDCFAPTPEQALRLMAIAKIARVSKYYYLTDGSEKYFPQQVLFPYFPLNEKLEGSWEHIRNNLQDISTLDLCLFKAEQLEHGIQALSGGRE